MTFTYFLVGLICLYLIYYAIIIAYDLNKKKKQNQTEAGEDEVSVEIDAEEFAPQSASEVYNAYEQEDSSKTESLETETEPSKVENLETEAKAFQEEKESEEKQDLDVVPLVEDHQEDEQDVAKYNSNLTNHGGLAVPAIKSLIKEAYDGENVFGSITSQFN